MAERGDSRAGNRWVQRSRGAPRDSDRRARWLRELSTVAAYRDRWHITGDDPSGRAVDGVSTEQGQPSGALAEGAAFVRGPMSDDVHRATTSYTREPQMGGGAGVEL